jgi:hypothetical protein
MSFIGAKQSLFYFLLCFSCVDASSASSFTAYHLSSFFRPHPHKKAALAFPFYLAHPMLFHTVSPCLYKITVRFNRQDYTPNRH